MNPFMRVERATRAMPVFTEYAWDFEKNKFMYDDQNRHIVLEKNEALKVWIRKALLVERYRHRAYFDDYGVELEHFIGKTPNDGISETEVFRYISEALLVNPYIVEVNDVRFSQEGKRIIMHLDVLTVYGKNTLGIEV